MVGPSVKAAVIDRNRGMARRLARVLASAGYDVEVPEGGELSAPPADGEQGIQLFVAEAAAGERVREAYLAAGPGPRRAYVLYGYDSELAAELSEPEILSRPGLAALLGCRPQRGQSELEAELLGVARHLRGVPLPPLQAHLLWGAQAFCTEVANTTGREAAVARVLALCTEELQVSRRVADSAGEVVHELITNAMYDAPVDERGQTRYANDRTAPVELPTEDRVTFRYGTDGLRLALEVVDRFGRLRRTDLQRSLRQGAAGRINRGSGGAGLGLSLVFRACQTLQVDVEPGQRTRVTTILDLEPARPVEGAPRPGRSLIFPDEADGPGPPASREQRP